MKNLNTIIFNPDLTVSSQTEKPIQAFSSYQNIIRVVVPFGTEYVPFGIFHATNATDDVAVPSQFILMLPAGTVDIGGENYFVYEQKVPEAIVASLRATKIEFVLSLWAKADNFIGVQRYDETAQGYNTTTYIAGQLLVDFPNAETNEYVRVFNTETDWQFNGTAWVNTTDVFETVLEDSRSEIIEFALYRGKATGKPTHKPNNTEALIDAINLKVSKTGDTMTGQLQFANAALTRLIMGNNNITTDAGINATTFANGNNSSDAVKFSNFAQLFDVQVATPDGGETWIDTVAMALAEKFGGILTVGQLGEFFVRRDGSTNMTGNLSLGGNQITNVGNVDGVDISAFKQAYDTHTHPISQVDNLQAALDTLTGNVAALGGAFIFRGVINQTTAQVEANTALLTARIDTLLERTPLTGDVLKDSDGGEWYYDGAAWRFMGQASIDLTQYYTKTEADGEFAALTHTHTESQITDLDKYTQAQVNTLLDGKAAVSHTHTISEVTNLETELSGKEPTFTKNTAFNKDFGNAAGTVTEGNDARLSDARTPLSHTHAISEVTNLQTALDSKPTIDSVTGKIPASVIPLQFEDVIQGYLSAGVFYEEVGLVTAIVGEQGKLYIDITTNTLYRFDGAAYVLIIDAAEITSLNDIPDVVITTVANDEALVYNTTTSKWENKVIPRTLSALGDTTITTPDNNEFLGYNGTAWVNTTLPSFSTTISGLTDTTITTPINNDFLVHDGTDWKNRQISKTDVALNNVQNYGIATQAEAELGTSDEKYMTPLKTAQAIQELSPPTDVSTEFAAGVIETNAQANTSFWTGTQAQYDALSTYDANTLYIITG